MNSANPSEVFGLWAIWQPPGSASLTTLMQQGFSRGNGGFGRPILLRGTMIDEEAEARPDYQVVNGTAVLELVGPLVKYDAFWFGGTSTSFIKECLASCLMDPNVTSIVLLIDSPGGTVSGTKDLADAVAAASQEKPCYTYFQDAGCSAAYWIGSQATKCFANETAIVGSIGTYTVVEDWSAAYEAAGAKINLVKAGEYKGIGVSGTKVTDEQLAEIQTLINALNDQFVRGAGRGRKMALRTMKTLADGRAHIAETAMQMGLIDGIQSWDETLAMMPKARAPRRSAQAIWSAETGLYEDASGGLAMPGDDLQIAPLAESLSDTAHAASDVAQLTQENLNMGETAQDTVTKPVTTAPAPLAAAVPVAATLAELKEACPQADAAFLMSQLEVGATATMAGKSWTIKLTEALAARDAELAAAKKATAKAVGVDTLGDKSTGATGSAGGDPISAFEALQATYFAKYADKNMAMRKLVAENTAAHEAYLAAYALANPFKRRA